jgi:hypothetical protein
LVFLALLIVGGLISVLVQRDGTEKGNTSHSAIEDASSVSASPSDPQLAGYSSTIRGQFGKSDTSAYDNIRIPRLSDHPYGSRDGRVVSIFFSFLSLSEPADLASAARVVVRGTVRNIGRPHFNSHDGAFWDPALHDEPGITDVANVIYRDVFFRVDEVWASDIVGIAPGSTIRFLSLGGQVRVTLPDKVARKIELGPGGSYVFANDAPVDLVVGEDAVLFLNSIPIDGLYEGQYGYRFELFPANDLLYKYSIQDDQAINAHDPTFNMPVGQLKKLIAPNLGRNAGPKPRNGTFRADPHPAVSGGSPPTETTEPPHTRGEG